MSYQKDRRNAVAESRSIAHRAISRRKKWVNGSYRKLIRQRLEAVDLDDIEETEIAVSNAKRHNWKKIPDVSLREFIDNKS
ncbi:hypothetical protein [uncultured Thalassolituus sp.]|uniref:hypothetical protein n=1 Tax=uncultured Thalassolituus sp. TaxID=285273 RepID=UPI0026072402|nr:hypothetical protein [uncultured Thalassolituus sp.]